MKRLLAVQAFTAVVLRQLLRDRTALIFIVALPVAIMIIIGTTFGGQQRLDLGVVAPEGSAVTERLLAALADGEGVRVHRYRDLESMRKAVRRFTVVGGVVVPVDADGELAASGATVLSIVVPRTSEQAVTVRRVLDGAVRDAAAPLTAAAFAAERTGTPIEMASATAEFLDGPDGAEAAAALGGGIDVHTEAIGTGRSAGESRFSQTATQNLVLFTFITALTSATLLVRARRTGILRRASATPAGVGTLLCGMAGGWFALCLVQSVVLIVVGAVGFGVRWGDPLAAALLVVVFDIVGVGAGLLVGAAGANEDRVGALTPVIGIVAGSLGGCTVPMQFFPAAMQRVARLTPHYWAVDAWDALVFDRAGVNEIVKNLAVLAGFGAVFVLAASVGMRRVLQSGR